MATHHPTEASQLASLASNLRWTSLTPEERTAATEAARSAFVQRWERLVDPDGTLDPADRATRAAEAKRAHYANMALKGAEVRRANAAARKAAGNA